MGEAIRGIIIENTFTSISEMMDSQFLWLAWDIIKKTFLRLKWDSITKVAKVRFPFLIIAGGKDELFFVLLVVGAYLLVGRSLCKQLFIQPPPQVFNPPPPPTSDCKQPRGKSSCIALD